MTKQVLFHTYTLETTEDGYMMNYLEAKQLPGMILCLDFEKAFDSLDWQFMFKVLNAYGFGDDMCQWISTLYKNTVYCYSQWSVYVMVFYSVWETQFHLICCCVVLKY